jgi:hypothetical protein
VKKSFWLVSLLLGVLLCQGWGAEMAGVTPVPPADWDDSDNPPYFALAGRVGTLGPGLDLTVGMASWINARVGGNFLRVKHGGSIKDVDYNMDIKLASLPMLLDIHPFRNEFRITGGVLYNRNEGDLDAKTDRKVKIGDREYELDQLSTLNGDVRFKRWAPYIGLGFGNPVLDADKRWGFVFDLGIMIQGRPDVTLTARGPVLGEIDFPANLIVEEDKVQKEANKLRVYPVLSFGISYQF